MSEPLQVSDRHPMMLRVLLLVLLLSLPAKVAESADCLQTLQDQVNRAPVGSTLVVPACTYHETVYISRPITLDGQNQAVIDGDGVRDRWLWIASDNVTIKNFTMRHAATFNQEGAIGNQEGIGFLTIDHNVLQDTAGGEQIGITTTHDSKVTNNDIVGGGQMGIGTYLNKNLLIQGNHIHGNNTANVDPYFAAGGIKAIAETGLRVIGNEVDHNYGPGIWCDISCDGVVIANNNVHDQPLNPIFYEISSHGEIYGNAISNSKDQSWGCITVSSSGSTYVHDNTCVDTLPLRAQLEERGDRPPGAGTNVRIENNKLVRPVPNQATSWWQQNVFGPLVVGANGNTDLNNQIVATLTPVPTATPVPTFTPTASPTPRATATPTVVCEVEVFLDGQSRGRKAC